MTVDLLRLKVLAQASRIAAGETSPRAGAARIWVLLAEADYPTELDEFRVFAGMVSEIQDHPELGAAYEARIVDEATRIFALERADDASASDEKR